MQYKLADGLNDIALSAFFGGVAFVSISSMIAVGITFIPLLSAMCAIYLCISWAYNVGRETLSYLKVRKENKDTTVSKPAEPGLDEKKVNENDKTFQSQPAEATS